MRKDRFVLVSLFVAALTLCAVGAAAAQAADEPQEQPKTGEAPQPVVESARKLTLDFYRGQLESIHMNFSAEMKQEIPIERLAALRTNVREQLGAEIEVVDEQLRIEEDYSVYRRLAKFEKYDGTIEVLWALRPDGKVGGFFIRDSRAVPEAAEPAPGANPESQP